MKRSNNAETRSIFSSPFISFLLITALLLGARGTGCGGSGGGMTTPPTDPLVVAQTNFRDKIWPFFQSPRCVNCHTIGSPGVPKTIFSGHPLSVPNPPDPSQCEGCHNQNVLGFAPPSVNPANPPTYDWVQAPDADHFVATDDPNTVRAHIILPPTPPFPALWNHLIGRGTDKTPVVQWAFFDGPDTDGGVPPPATPIHAGAIPKGMGGPHGGGGQIPQAEMLKWADWEPAVQQWICLELKAGTDPAALGKPASFTCPP